MKTYILSKLLFNANKWYKDTDFYTIKNKILTKYGIIEGYDFQFIKGKECHRCGGTGIFIGYSWPGYTKYKDQCHSCDGTGMYVFNHWNVLRRVRLGNRIFHTPIKRTYTKPPVGSVIIEGYINHEPTKYSKDCRMIIFLLYNRKLFFKKLSFGKFRHINPGYSLYRHLNNLIWEYKKWQERRKGT